MKTLNYRSIKRSAVATALCVLALSSAAVLLFPAIAAAAQAAHDVLINQFPGGAASFDTLLATQLAVIPNGVAKTRAVQLGAAAAANMLAARTNDGAATAEAPYTPGSQPGDYQFTPPFNGPPFNGYAAVPKWGQVTPFVIDQVEHFRAPAPYTVHDLEYTFDFNEIKALGSQNRAARTADQTDFATSNAALAYASIASLDSKYRYNFWRPRTAMILR